jgi:hypothetical protein
MSWDEPVTALTLAAMDLVVAAVFALLVTGSSAGRVEAKPLALRRRALENAHPRRRIFRTGSAVAPIGRQACQTTLK